MDNRDSDSQSSSFFRNLKSQYFKRDRSPSALPKKTSRLLPWKSKSSNPSTDSLSSGSQCSTKPAGSVGHTAGTRPFTSNESATPTAPGTPNSIPNTSFDSQREVSIAHVSAMVPGIIISPHSDPTQLRDEGSQAFKVVHEKDLNAEEKTPKHPGRVPRQPENDIVSQTEAPGVTPVQQSEAKHREEIWKTVQDLRVVKRGHEIEQSVYTDSHGKEVVVVERLGQILKCVEDYAKIIDVAIQHSPDTTALIWAGIRFLLNIANNALQLMEALGVTLATVVEKLATCEVYAHIYREAQVGKIHLATNETTDAFAARLDNALKDLYKAVNDLMNRVKQYFDSNKSGIKRAISLLKPFSIWIQPCIEAILEKEKVVVECAQLATMQRTKEGTQRLEHLQRVVDNMKKELSSLSKLDDILAMAKENADVTKEILVGVHGLRDLVNSLQPQQREILDTSRALDPELQKLKRRYLVELENDNFEVDLYIATKGMDSVHAPEHEHFDLHQRLQEFLSQNLPQKVCLIQGVAGSGKSTFNHHLARELWDQYDNTPLDDRVSSTIVPVFISLASLYDSEQFNQDLIEKFFVRLGWSAAQIQEAREKVRFVFILDGYDEIPRHDRNFYIDNRLGDWNMGCKVVITSRPEYLDTGYQSKFYPSRQQQLLQEYWIAPFSTESVRQYITKYTAAKGTQHTANHYDELVSKPEVLSLIRNPFLLRMLMTVQPASDPSSNSGTARLSVKELNRVTLYENFLNYWFTQAQARLDAIQLSDVQRHTFHELCEGDFTHEVRLFCQNFAVELYRHQALEATYIPTKPNRAYVSSRGESKQKLESSVWAAYLNNEDDVRLIRFSSPLLRNQHSYRFLHKSLRDFLIAQSLWEDIGLLNEFDIVDDPGVIDFIVEHALADAELQQRLESCIEVSKTNPEGTRAAANAITILVRIGWWFLGQDLRGIRIPGADLNGGYFSGAQLQNADLRRVHMRGIYLAGADLTGAYMDNVWFGEKPYLKIPELNNMISYFCTASGEILAICDNFQGQELQLWSLTQKRLVHKFSALAWNVTCGAFSPDGAFLALGYWDGSLYLWSMSDFSLVHTLTSPADHNTEHGEFKNRGIHYLVFSSGGTTNLLASIHQDHVHKWVSIWSVVDKTLMHRFLVHDLEHVYAISFSPDGLSFASLRKVSNGITGDDRYLYSLYSTADMSVLYSSAPLRESNAFPAFSPNGRFLAIVADQQTANTGTMHIRLLSMLPPDYQLIHSLGFPTSRGILDALAFSPNSQLICASTQSTICVWSLLNYNLLYRIDVGAPIRDHSNAILSFSLDSRILFSACEDGTIRQWEISYQMVQPFRYTTRTHGMEINALILSPHYQFADVMIVSLDDCVHIWSTQARRPDKIILEWDSDDPPDIYNMFLCAREGKLLVSGSFGYTVRLWSVPTGQNIHTYNGHTGWVNTVVFSPDGTMLASGSDDYTVRLWSVSTGQNVHTCDGHTGRVWALVFSPDGAMLASGSGSEDYTVRLWSVSTGQNIHTYDGHTGWVNTVVFSPDGTMIASGSDDCTIQLWSVLTGQSVHTYTGHTSDLLTVVFSPDGTMLASGSIDCTVRLWSVSTGQNVHTYDGHNGWANTVVFSPDGTMLASGNEDYTVRLWSVSTGESGFKISTQSRPTVLNWGTMQGMGTVLAIGTERGHVEVWKTIWEGGSQSDGTSFIDTVLVWSSPSLGLQVKNTHLQGVTGLDSEQIELLQQRGAICEGRVDEMIE